MGCGPGECNSFREDYSAVYPHDELKADPEYVGLPQPEGPTIEGTLHNALHHIEGAEQRWKLLKKNGATNSELMEAIRREIRRRRIFRARRLAHEGWKHRRCPCQIRKT